MCQVTFFYVNVISRMRMSFHHRLVHIYTICLLLLGQMALWWDKNNVDWLPTLFLKEEDKCVDMEVDEDEYEMENDLLVKVSFETSSIHNLHSFEASELPCYLK